MNVQPYFIIPILIKQPTWGGQYIAQFKGIGDASVLEENIGQSYELSALSRVSTEPATQNTYSVTDASLMNRRDVGGLTETLDLQSLIASNPLGMLGKVESETLADLNNLLLIKFTQAKNNSYQVHVQPGHEFSGWQAKPESWYYLEEGRATLGVKTPADLPAYRRVCLEIHEFALQTSFAIKSGVITIQEGRAKLAEFIAQHPVTTYVNQVTIPKDGVVNLDQGGIHHSWEYDRQQPLGNILYEVQTDVKDERSTIRSFDQGSIKDTGDLRPLHIEDYFKAINSSSECNQSDLLIRQPQPHQHWAVSASTLFDTHYYTLTKYAFLSHAVLPLTTPVYHHLFVVSGPINIKYQDQVITANKGSSLFIPAGCEKYVLEGEATASVLISTPALAETNPEPV